MTGEFIAWSEVAFQNAKVFLPPSFTLSVSLDSNSAAESWAFDLADRERPDMADNAEGAAGICKSTVLSSFAARLALMLF